MKLKIKESDLIALIENVIREQSSDVENLKKYYVRKGSLGDDEPGSSNFYIRYANKWLYKDGKKWAPSSFQTKLDMKFLNADGSLKPAPEKPKTGLGKNKEFYVYEDQIKDGTPSNDTIYVFSQEAERWYYDDGTGKWVESSQQEWLNKNFAGQQYGDLDADDEVVGGDSGTGTSGGGTICVTGSESQGTGDMGKGKSISVDGDEQRNKLKGKVDVGTEVTIDGKKTTVSRVWLDKDSRPGAFQFENGLTTGNKLCFTPGGGFVNKTSSYKATTYTLDDIKAGKAKAKLGDKGKAVIEIQKLVGAKPDNYFGPKTQAKVKEYQKSQNVPATGVVDSRTLGGTVTENHNKSLKDIVLEVLAEKKRLEEQEGEGVEGGGVESGVSDAGGKGASTWKTGLTRGAANPAEGMTHWADSYTINRGKANPLNESKWYNTVGDIVGIVDPTGVVDGINAMSYFKQGDIFYGMLSLVSLIPYAGDLVAKPIIGAMKLGKFGGKGINAAAKSGSASKLAGEMGKSGMGKKFMGTFKDKKTQGFLAGLFAKIGKIPGFGRLAKDGQTYTKLFTKAANISKTGAPVKIFRKSGGLLTKMQRRGLLGRTKLYSKFAAWMLGLGATQQVIANMPEDEMNDKFKEWASSEEGQEHIMSMPEEEKTDFIAVLKEMLREN